MTVETIAGYHFTGDKLRNGEQIPPVGKWLRHIGEIIPCVSGLHCSEHPHDALRYAPGSMLHKVELRGELQPHAEPADKWCGRERRIIATIDASALLMEYARWCALQVAHLWDMKAIVRKYLETGNTDIWLAARALAWEAAWEAGMASARKADWAAARILDQEMAGKAITPETLIEARARSAARFAAMDAARGPARDAETAKQQAKLLEMVEAKFALKKEKK